MSRDTILTNRFMHFTAWYDVTHLQTYPGRPEQWKIVIKPI